MIISLIDYFIQLLNFMSNLDTQKISQDQKILKELEPNCIFKYLS
jgi:hypothetical protein